MYEIPKENSDCRDALCTHSTVLHESEDDPVDDLYVSGIGQSWNDLRCHNAILPDTREV